MAYTLQADGDLTERTFYTPLIQPHFPSYETFWKKFVVPLTNRPGDAQLKTDTDLALIGKGDHELCLAQLHYSILQHLSRAYQLREDPNYRLDHLVFSLSTIIGAQDVAFELLERFKNPTSYDPWLGTRSGRVNGGREAQNNWKKNNSYPLQDIRNYRNHLVHGRTPPGFGGQYPKIGKEPSYFDWRKVTAVTTLPTADFSPATDIHDSAFNQTMIYLEDHWKAKLLPNI